MGDDTPAQPLKEEEWLRVQYQMGHHDIWWLKAQQMNVGNWTLLLLGALVTISKLLLDQAGAPPTSPVPPEPWKGWVLGGFAGLVTLLGTLHVWDLFYALVQTRRRAASIVAPLKHQVFQYVANPERRNKQDLVFPIAITAILFGGFALVFWYIGARWTIGNLPRSIAIFTAAMVAALAVWGYVKNWGRPE